MPIQDKSGNKYEKLLAASLRVLGHQFKAQTGLNYLHPGKHEPVAIPNTYIQPDLVVRHDLHIQSILYVTHWSKSRNCAFKFWRTWEEQAQQKVVLPKGFVSINCIFEALPQGQKPSIILKSNELPLDESRGGEMPIAFRGWYPGTTYALVDSFDVTLAFPVGYEPVNHVMGYDEGDSDQLTTKVLKKALGLLPKPHLQTQWSVLQKIRKQAHDNHDFKILEGTASRYRIGLLHLYLFYRMFVGACNTKHVSLQKFVRALIQHGSDKIELHKLVKTQPFDAMKYKDLVQFFEQLSQIFVRTGKQPKMFCSISPFSFDGHEIHKVSFNKDLSICLVDLADHIDKSGFIDAIISAFSRFDTLPSVDEAIADLANFPKVQEKEAFVRAQFGSVLNDADGLSNILSSNADPTSAKRAKVSNHKQNWVLEMLVYLTGLNTAEDIYTRLTEEFEKSGHSLWHHAPFADHAKLLPYFLQGQDPCDTWSKRSKKITLTKPEFHKLSWEAIARCIVSAFEDRGAHTRDSEEVIRRYREAKSRRIISSELNGFEVMIDNYLGDLCYLKFKKNSDAEKQALRAANCASVQTELTKELWNSASLDSRLEGVGHDGKWLIKVQSAQDGNEGHKTKELSGRCRAFHLTWQKGVDIQDREHWSFKRRKMPKVALVLDGDWDAVKKKNLYEAGWDWLGDVSELSELRDLIKGT